MIYIQLTKSMFRDEFARCDRKENFSYEGLGELYDYLNEQDAFEMDVIALCCEYAEGCVYETLKEYNLESIDDLEDKTVVIWHDQINARVLYQQF